MKIKYVLFLLFFLIFSCSNESRERALKNQVLELGHILKDEIKRNTDNTNTIRILQKEANMCNSKLRNTNVDVSYIEPTVETFRVCGVVLEPFIKTCCDGCKAPWFFSISEDEQKYLDALDETGALDQN